MARIGITYQQVADLAQELVGSGQQPTIERLRARLKTGSNSTINKYLREWRTNHDQQKDIPIGNLPAELVNMLKGLWERVMAQAQEKVDVITQTFEEKRLQQEELIQKLKSDKTRLEQAEKQLNDKLECLVQKNLSLEETITKSQVELISLQHKKEGLEQQLSDKQSYIETLKQQNKQTQANLEHYQAAALEQRQHDRLQAEKLQQELNQTIYQLKLESDITRQKNNELQHLHEQLTLTHHDLEAQCSKISEQLKITENELILANKVIVEQTASQQHWQLQYQTLSHQSEKQLQEIIALQVQNAVIGEKFATISAALCELTEQNKTLTKDKWRSEQEITKLHGQLMQRLEEMK